MKANTRTKFVSEATTTLDDVSVRRPFKLESKNKRRFIRLEISAPMSLQKIRGSGEGFWPDGHSHVIQGLILNISAGGVLVDLNESINEGDVVSMHFTLQEIEALDCVLGLVKRVDRDADGTLTGIEFISREGLEDMFSKGEIDMLPEKYADFDRSVRMVLDKYVFRKTALSEDGFE